MAIPLSASSFDSSNFSNARVISSSVMLLPVSDRRERARERNGGTRRERARERNGGTEERESKGKKWRDQKGREVMGKMEEGEAMRRGKERRG